MREPCVAGRRGGSWMSAACCGCHRSRERLCAVPAVSPAQRIINYWAEEMPSRGPLLEDCVPGAEDRAPSPPPREP